MKKEKERKSVFLETVIVGRKCRVSVLLLRSDVYVPFFHCSFFPDVFRLPSMVFVFHDDRLNVCTLPVIFLQKLMRFGWQFGEIWKGVQFKHAIHSGCPIQISPWYAGVMWIIINRQTLRLLHLYAGTSWVVQDVQYSEHSICNKHVPFPTFLALETFPILPKTLVFALSLVR